MDADEKERTETIGWTLGYTVIGCRRRYSPEFKNGCKIS